MTEEIKKEMQEEIKKIRDEEDDYIGNLLVRYEVDYLNNKNTMGGIRECYISMLKNICNKYTALENLIIQRYVIKSMNDQAA